MNFPVGAAARCDLLILFFIKSKDRSLVALVSSYSPPVLQVEQVEQVGGGDHLKSAISPSLR